VPTYPSSSSPLPPLSPPRSLGRKKEGEEGGGRFRGRRGVRALGVRRRSRPDEIGAGGTGESLANLVHRPAFVSGRRYDDRLENAPRLFRVKSARNGPLVLSRRRRSRGARSRNARRFRRIRSGGASRGDVETYPLQQETG